MSSEGCGVFDANGALSFYFGGGGVGEMPLLLVQEEGSMVTTQGGGTTEAVSFGEGNNKLVLP